MTTSSIQTRATSIVRGALWLLPPLVVLASIWTPVLRAYRVPRTTISHELIQTARNTPPSSLLQSVANQTVIERPYRDRPAELVRAAEAVLEGNATLPGFGSERITIPFDEGDLDRGRLAWRLAFASFSVPGLLLDAYEISGRREFLDTARDMIVAWADYDEGLRLPKDLWWNDHAIAARIYVLADFWRLYRVSQDFDPRVARAVLAMAGRSGHRLADPRHFTFATNHGVIQNLALWHLCLVFPYLPGTEQWKPLARERLDDQNRFHLHEEGVVLEHSAGYHRSGLQWLEMALHDAALLGITVPDAWRTKVEKAREFYAFLARPDSSLPMYGDTQAEPEPRPPVAAFAPDGTPVLGSREWRPSAPSGLYPASGYAVWWTGLESWPDPDRLDQTVVAWSWYPGLGHKHADEMSVLLWARGVTWWTNVGYWPYDDTYRSAAESWEGSNAPHLAGEPAASDRSTRLRWLASSPTCRFLDLARSGPAEFRARRQVLRLQPDLWIVVDHTAGTEERRTSTTWTASADVRIDPRDPATDEGERSPGSLARAYELTTKDGAHALDAFLIGSAGTEVRELRGLLEPFAGWQVVNRVPKAAPALVVERPANDSWSAAVWSLRSAGSSPAISGSPSMRRWKGPEDWELVLPAKGGATTVRRKADRVTVEVPRKPRFEQVLSPAPSVEASLAAHRAAYEAVAARYPRYRDYMEYRTRVTTILLPVLVLQAVVFFIAWRMRGRWLFVVRVLSVVAWVGIWAWLTNVYFKS